MSDFGEWMDEQVLRMEAMTAVKWAEMNRNPESHWGAAFYRGGTFLFDRWQYQYWMVHGGYPIGVEIIHKPEEW